MSTIIVARWDESSDTHYYRWGSKTPISGCGKEKQNKTKKSLQNIYSHSHERNLKRMTRAY